MCLELKGIVEQTLKLKHICVTITKIHGPGEQYYHDTSGINIKSQLTIVIYFGQENPVLHLSCRDSKFGQNIINIVFY